MKIVEGTYEVPVIYTAHHASHDFGEFADRVALSPEQQIRFSDYGTDVTVPLNGIATIIAERSRALGDLNRDPDDPERFKEQDYGKPVNNPVWKTGAELNELDKEFCQANFYTPFHEAIVDQLKTRDELTFVVAWDNTAHYEIGNDSSGEPVIMKPFVLSNRGLEESSQSGPDELTSCDPRFLDILARHFALELEKHGVPNEVHLNLVFKGGYICRQYSTLRNEAALRELGITCDVQSLQLEYDTAITHDQITLEPMPDKIQSLQQSFANAIQASFLEYSSK